MFDLDPYAIAMNFQMAYINQDMENTLVNVATWRLTRELAVLEKYISEDVYSMKLYTAKLEHKILLMHLLGGLSNKSPKEDVPEHVARGMRLAVSIWLLDRDYMEEHGSMLIDIVPSEMMDYVEQYAEELNRQYDSKTQRSAKIPELEELGSLP